MKAIEAKIVVLGSQGTKKFIIEKFFVYHFQNSIQIQQMDFS